MELQKRSSFGWGSSDANSANPTRGLVIHYDSKNQGLAKKSHSACVSYWKWCRSFHMGPSRGWADVGYSYAACPHGYVMEGRGLKREQAAQPGGNTTYYSVTLMSGPDENPTEAQIQAVRELRVWLMSRGVAGAMKGHRDFVSTSCPGNKLYAMVQNGTFGKSPTINWTETMVEKLPTLRRGSTGEHVQTLRGLLHARSHPEIGKVEGPFDGKVETAVKAVQRWAKLDDDGIVGPKTWPALLRVK